MTSAFENITSRVSAAYPQQRSSSIGRSMKTQSRAGLFLARASRSPSSKQLFQSISRQATFGAFRDLISACKASRVTGFFSATGTLSAPACPYTRPANTNAAALTVNLCMALFPFAIGLLLADRDRPAEETNQTVSYYSRANREVSRSWSILE